MELFLHTFDSLIKKRAKKIYSRGCLVLLG